MEEVFKKISEKIITEEDLVFFLDQLALVKKIIFSNTEISLSQRLKNKVDERIRREIEKLEERGEIPLFVEEQSTFFEQLEKFLLKIPKVQLEIAFEPSNEFLLEIDNWFKENVGKKVILDIFVNPKIVGGARIEYQGKWVDFSLGKEIEKLYGGV